MVNVGGINTKRTVDGPEIDPHLADYGPLLFQMGQAVLLRWVCLCVLCVLFRQFAKLNRMNAVK